jgi:hypothetical protein
VFPFADVNVKSVFFFQFCLDLSNLVGRNFHGNVYKNPSLVLVLTHDRTQNTQGGVVLIKISHAFVGRIQKQTRTFHDDARIFLPFVVLSEIFDRGVAEVHEFRFALPPVNVLRFQ